MSAWLLIGVAWLALWVLWNFLNFVCDLFEYAARKREAQSAHKERESFSSWQS